MTLGVDVGATKTEIVSDSGSSRFPTPGTEEELIDLIRQAGGAGTGSVCFAIAGPADDRPCHLTNRGLTFDPERVAAALGYRVDLVVNDTFAAASRVRSLESSDFRTVQEGSGRIDGPKAVAAIGTGLGVAFLTSDGEVIPGEGGHATLPIVTEQDDELLHLLLHNYGRISVERIVSGQGLRQITKLLSGVDYEPAQIVQGWSEGHKACVRIIEIFLRYAGTFFGDLALQVRATGGVWICGGPPAAWPELFESNVFLDAFAVKGRFTGWMESVPIRVVTRTDLVACGAWELAGKRS